MEYAFTRWILKTNVNELPLYIYETPVRNIHHIYSENKRIVVRMRKENHWKPIGFYKQYIGSFEPIEYLDPTVKWTKQDFRTIRLDDPDEVTLFKNVLLSTIEHSLPYKKWKVQDKRRIRSALPIASMDEVDLYRQLQLNCEIDQNGRITIGFDLTHRFLFRKNVYEMLQENPNRFRNEKPVNLIHQETGQRYQWVELLDLTVSEIHPDLKQSIIDYMRENFQEHWLERYQIKPDTRLIRTKIPNNPKRYDHPPQLLKLECNFESAPIQLIRKVKSLSPDQKMKLSIELAKEILGNCKYIQLEPDGYLIHKHQFKIVEFKAPELLFGHNTKIPALIGEKEQIYKGLSTYGVYRTGDYQLSLPYFFIVDHRIRNFLKQPEQQHITESIDQFLKRIHMLSARAGVILEKSSEQIKGVVLTTKKITTDHLIQQLKEIIKKYKITEKHTVMFLTENESDCYDTVKKVFGSQNIATQFVGYDTVLDEQFYEWNLLLNIYVKNKIQPWLLAKSLHSDCFIGLDVSHEQGLHASGGVQVVGSNGEIIFSKSFGGNERGEIISEETLTNIIVDAIDYYREKKQSNLSHITFHRDGFARKEELEVIEKILKPRGITFDYVSIVKNPKIRMALRKNRQDQWKTKIGLCYIRGNLAYLTSTNSIKNVGMAEPIKIEVVQGTLPIEKIVEDIYALSFMNVHAVRKSRLPNTINYADFIASALNRGYVPKVGSDKILNV